MKGKNLARQNALKRLAPNPSLNGSNDGSANIARSRKIGNGWVERFLAYIVVERGVSQQTRSRYVHAIKKLKTYAREKRKSLRDLTVPDCRRWKLIMLRNGLRPSTVNTNLISARMFFRFLFSEGYLASNPFDLVEFVPRDDLSQRCLTEEEVDRLLSTPDVSTYYGLLDRTMIELLYSSALRPGELVNLKLCDIDLSQRRVTCNGKGSKQRIVPVGRSAIVWLKKYLFIRRHLRDSQPTGFFFVKEDGSQLSRMLLWRHIKAHAMRAGLGNVTPRTLRHSCATHMHNHGATLAHVQKLLGHSSKESTKGYTHTSTEHLRLTYDKNHPRATFDMPLPKRHKGFIRAKGSNGGVTEH